MGFDQGANITNNFTFINNLLIEKGSKVGISTLNPKSSLDVNGSLSIGVDINQSCSSKTKGTIMYANDTFFGCYGDKNEWRPIIGSNIITNKIILTENQNNIILNVLFGSPTIADSFTLIIEEEVIIGSGSTQFPAISTGFFPAGSNITIINKGRIQGAGGNGGRGGTCNPICSQGGAGFPGSPGGIALELLHSTLFLNNTNGEIWGGGNGGSGGTGPGAGGGVGGAGSFPGVGGPGE